MPMGNYLCVTPEDVSVMATTESGFGMRHPTVVPTNFEPTGESVDGGEPADGGTTDDEPPVDSE